MGRRLGFVPRLRAVAFGALLLACGVACGSRTGLFGDEAALGGGSSSSSGGGGGVGIGTARDAETDAIPPLDARPPTNVNRADCPDADALLVYTITADFSLQSFDPSSGQFKNIGRISCPVSTRDSDDSPFSMAVDRRGVASILYRDGNLYRVSTATGACLGTSYTPGQSGFRLFGMGFATNDIGPTETLYVSGSKQQDLFGNDSAEGLAHIDPSSFKLDVVTTFPSVKQAELTGTGDGRLYAFYRKNDDADGNPPSFIGQLDIDEKSPTRGQVIGERQFDSVAQGQAWAFAFWGGDFYMFTSQGRGGGPSTVTRYRPSDDSVTDVATNPEPIVGAGVSTCAPQQ